jgi:branched-chain amino acid aminotransferase
VTSRAPRNRPSNQCHSGQNAQREGPLLQTDAHRQPDTWPTPPEVREQQLRDPGFGRWFTDHMVTAHWTADAGWDATRLGPHEPLALSPAAMVLHYGQAIFEGLKAYRQQDRIAIFRPRDHALRFERSAARLAMPQLPIERFVESCVELVRADEEWVPRTSEHSLYLRPLMFATEAHLGVRSASEFTFAVIASPVAPYASEDLRPLDVVLGGTDVRAAPGGVGAAKCSSNYAASLLTRQRALASGHDDVVWLDAIDHRWVEETSAMNLFFVRRRGADVVLITPPTGDTILAGITRSSLIDLAQHVGYGVAERPIGIDEWAEEARSGVITEAFACGTGAIVAPIGRVTSAVESWTMRDAATSPIAHRLRERLLDIQEGRDEDVFGWMRSL